MAPGGAAFRLQGVSVTYGPTLALRAVDLEIQPGEIVGFVGLSGAGKTTLLRLLNGSVRPAEGTVQVDGQDLNQLSSREIRRVRSEIGFVYQEFNLIPTFRVLQNVVAGRLGRMTLLKTVRALFVPPGHYVREVHEILEQVGIPEKLYERTDRLSGGQRQRVAIARALFQKPKAVLADEPVSNVDPANARIVLELLTGIARDRGLTLCVSLHNLTLAKVFFPRLVGLREGRVIFDRPPPDFGDEQFATLFETPPVQEAG